MWFCVLSSVKWFAAFWWFLYGEYLNQNLAIKEHELRIRVPFGKQDNTQGCSLPIETYSNVENDLSTSGDYHGDNSSVLSKYRLT
jgi:hypothetical protein